jgi:DNA repair protein RecO (recombination protein O)
VQTLTLAPLQDDGRYRLVLEGGLRAAHGDDEAWLAGADWNALSAALDKQAAFTAALQAVASWPAAEQARLRQQLRALLHYHCGNTCARASSCWRCSA